MKGIIKFFSLAILIGVSFNSVAGSPKPWTPTIQPKDCVGTFVTSSQFTADTNTGLVFYSYSSKPECNEVIDKGYASGVRGVVRGDVDYDKWGASVNYGLRNNRFNFAVVRYNGYTFPAPIKKGGELKIESADWIR
ncbi:TPA: hypothetical protein J1246_004656 [Escherichia coli]|nr:hypothetical protein [Escherichia coli]HBA8925225.1 hypothetical protein [Escherichia coli]